ncbi:MAG TPA: hypothetical protein VG100_13795 [Xanthobacteraceae bacterium]|jgi:thymidylate synthase|nr:hypothetical protein [Xanthobacteraceae bacterium]
MKNLDIRDEVSLLFFAVLLCTESKSGYDGSWQVAPLFCSLPYRDNCLDRLLALKQRLGDRFPQLIAFGDRRAAKAYQSQYHSITKPSYILRLRKYGSQKRSQIRNITQIAHEEPASGGLVFSVFKPSDLEQRLRPGYVPCLISGSFLLHEDEFQMNVFFRSQSVVEFGIQDLIFLRQFQAEMVGEVNAGRTVAKRKQVAPGALNIHFGRVIIQRRLMRHNRMFVRREQILEPWLKIVERFMQEQQFVQ